MLKIIFFVNFICVVFIYSTASHAASGNGRMSATIVNPLKMTLERAKEFCTHESHAAKCNIIRERVEKISNENNQRQNPVSRQISISYDYNILTTNFE